MMGAYSNPMANLMMVEAVTGNDLFSNGLEGLGTMSLLNGMQPFMGGAMMGRYPYASGFPMQMQMQPQVSPMPQRVYAQGGQASPRGAAHQYMPMGGMGYQNPMKNIFMMEAMTGGD